jgi:hypothetical protein
MMMARRISTPIIRSSKYVSGSAYCRPNFAPTKPDDHNSTNTAGAAKTAQSSNVRGIFLGPAAVRTKTRAEK